MDHVFDLSERTYQFWKAIVLYIKDNEFHAKYTFSIIDQLLRSATSIGANVIEAKCGNSRKGFICYYSIALRSANETKYWLRLISDTLTIEKKEITLLLNEVAEISKIIARSILTMKRNNETRLK